MATVASRNMDQPDETRTPPMTIVDVVDLEGAEVGRFTFEPGWKWSDCIKPVVGPELSGRTSRVRRLRPAACRPQRRHPGRPGAGRRIPDRPGARRMGDRRRAVRRRGVQERSHIRQGVGDQLPGRAAASALASTAVLPLSGGAAAARPVLLQHGAAAMEASRTCRGTTVRSGCPSERSRWWPCSRYRRWR